MRAKKPTGTIVLVASVIAAVFLAATALGADPQGPQSVVLGKTPNYPEAGCPNTKTCLVVARVTGVQMKADAVDHPFRSPTSGQLVSWWLKLPRLHSSQLKSFAGLFGGRPAARIAVLRRGERGRVRLVRQSETVQLSSHLGAKGRVRFRLAQPLPVKEGDYIGLTAVTWVPAFAVGLDTNNDVWLASRPKERCNTPSSSEPDRFAAYYKRNDAHLESSTVRHYRCLYRTARLLYWARIVPNTPQPGAGTQPPQPEG
jgi:hypothetical protein